MLQKQKIQVHGRDISFTEKVLLREGNTFDDERLKFIKNFETIDLQAVPGSGKTTALLAKLLIIEKHLPFSNGAAVLVISHTNSAVEEIRNKISKHCPKLFSYPNYVGTIQGFVNHFLAIPYYANKYNSKPCEIDNDHFDYAFKGLFPRRLFSGLEHKFQNNCGDFIKGYHIDADGSLKLNFSDKSFPYKSNPPSETYNKLKEIKSLLNQRGILHFTDAYLLGSWYLKRYPRIKSILQKRFAYVFVDEMQDMDKHQYDLLEELFFNDACRYQRIGDKNQAIHSKEVKLEDIWTDRSEIISISGSHRLTQSNAEVVKYFGLEYLNIEGRRRNEDGSLIQIKPQVIVFDDDTIELVIEEFTKIIKGLQEAGKIPINPSNPFKAVGWITAKPEKEKIAIKDYHTEFERNEHKPKAIYNDLKSYLLYFEKNQNALRTIRTNILNALLRVLSLEKIVDEKEKRYTKTQLIYFLRRMEHREIYLDFKLRIYQWSFQTVNGKTEDALIEIKKYIPQFLKEVFNVSKIKLETQQFMDNFGGDIPTPSVKVLLERKNIVKKNGINVEIGTVHSVKGETHTATLYLETYYYKDGKKSYESQRLDKQFGMKQIDKAAGDRVRQSAKMVYVGFSRPTHLLCFAIHKDRISHLDKAANWEKIHICSA